MSPARPVVVIEDDAITRLAQVTLDPDTEPARIRGIEAYYSADGTDFTGWLAATRRAIAGLYPAQVKLATDPQSLRRQLREADAVIVQDLAVGAEELDAAPRLRIVHKFGAILRHIDEAACSVRRIIVKAQPRRVNIACAEHVMMLMLALAKRITELNGRMTVPRLEAAGFRPRVLDPAYAARANWGRVTGLRTLNGATLGIVGMGEIGRPLAQRAAAFGMNVIYHQRSRLDPATEAALQARYVALDDLLSTSDYLSLLLPGNPSTRNIIGAAELARMKPDAMLINTSRAELVDRAALLAALRGGRLAGAGLDMLWREPAEEDDEFLQLPNVVCTPHVAVAGRENGLQDMAQMLGNVQDALRSAPPPPG